ncbi:MAG: hypothetical protein Ct9H90mP13_00780 [Pseudomonadota bacterium]|nr:MAG: hypothetical protein Ct9H90mP13_00780 [Pseudomonadota bacterium]
MKHPKKIKIIEPDQKKLSDAGYGNIVTEIKATEVFFYAEATINNT